MGRNCSQTSLLVHGSGFSRPDKESAELGVGSFERLYIRLLFGGGRVVEGWNQHGMATVLITSQSRTPFSIVTICWQPGGGRIGAGTVTLHFMVVDSHRR